MSVTISLIVPSFLTSPACHVPRLSRASHCSSRPPPPPNSFQAFESDLFQAKLTIIRSWLLFPGSILFVQAGLFYKLDGVGQFVQYYEASKGNFADNLALWGAAFGLH